MVFNSLSAKFNNILKKLKLKKGILTERDLDEVLRNIRVALLEADVNIKVATEVANKIKIGAVGKEIIDGVSAEELIIKLSNDAIKEVLGGDDYHGYKIKSDNKQERIMMVGLQGSGKTTTTAKLANFLKTVKAKIEPVVCSLDYYRPAAIKQLELLCTQNEIKFFKSSCNFDSQSKNVLETAKDVMTHADKNETIIFDTAGRTSIDDSMMNELKELKTIIKPTQIILVVDTMIGKTCMDIARQFNDLLGLTGLIFTKADSDAKAGAILSVRQALDLPIHFLCTGEKIRDIDEFHAERIANRILGMGDIVSLVEKASNIMGDDNSDKLKEKAAKGELDLFDVLDQFKFLRKMGGLPFVSKFLPTEMLGNSSVSESKVSHFEAIILSMTKKERKNPKLVMQSASRKKRVADGSGTNTSLVQELLMLHSKISKIAQQFSSFDKGGVLDKFKMGSALTSMTKKD